MKLIIETAPANEPITLAELKKQLRLDSGTFLDNTASNQSLVPKDYALAVGYAYEGTGVDVLGKSAVVKLNSGENQATGTVDAKIQESDVFGSGYTDWDSGAFTQVTTANDNTIQRKEYTGTKQYIRVVAQVLLASCEFSATVETEESTLNEDSLLNRLIQTSRIIGEAETKRAFITQVWNIYLNDFPAEDFIELPFGNLQSVGSFSYKDSDGDTTVMIADTDYIVETNGIKRGRILLPENISWPSATLYISKPITIQITCGYGDLESDIPDNVKSLLLMLCTKLYNTRGEPITGTVIDATVADKAIASLVYLNQLW